MSPTIPTVVADPIGDPIGGGPAAARRAAKISQQLETIAESFEAVMPLIREAIVLEDYLALGYRSPGDYVSDRFGATLARLPIELRRETVRELTAAGLSTRAIAPVVGVDQKTVVRDRAAGREAGKAHASPAGGSTPPTRPAGPDLPSPEDFFDSPAEYADASDMAELDAEEFDEVLSAARDAGDLSRANVAALAREAAANRSATAPAPSSPPAPVVGLDGKAYPATKPRTQPRRPLHEAARDLTYNVDKLTNGARRLAGDDRLAANAERITPGVRYSARELAAALLDLMAALGADLNDEVRQLATCPHAVRRGYAVTGTGDSASRRCRECEVLEPASETEQW